MSREPRKITVIPADPALSEKNIRKKHLRVAPYCRKRFRPELSAP